MAEGSAVAVLGGVRASGLVDVTSDLAALDGSGWWAVLLPYEGPPICARFRRLERVPPAAADRGWVGPPPGSWRSSMTRVRHREGVGHIRAAIARGDVYQVNLTRRLSAPAHPAADILDLGALLARHHPAPHAATLHLPAHGVAIAELETVPRGPYCGAVGWVDADAGIGELNVAIRTFWLDDGELHLGTGGAITWDSRADGEWRETELKARALLSAASPRLDEAQGRQRTRQMSPTTSPTVK